MSLEQTLADITDLIDVLQSTYEDQADLVAAELKNQRAVINSFKQWRCDFLFCTYASDTPPPWHHYLGHWDLNEYPHPVVPEANESAAEVQSQFDVTDESQTTLQEQLSSIPADIGNFAKDWFSIDNALAHIYYPSNSYEVPSGGQGWLGAASGAYGAAIGTQHSAAQTVRSVVGSMVAQTTAFLGRITDMMASLSTLATEQNGVYTNAFQGLSGLKPMDYIGAINLVVDLMKDQNGVYVRRVGELGKSLAAAVDEVITTGLLENDLAEIGPSGKWPAPRQVDTAADNPGTPTYDELVVDAKWFRAHIDFWDDIFDEMREVYGKAEAARSLPSRLVNMPHFSSMTSEALNELASDIGRTIMGGYTAANSMSNALFTAINAYLTTEASSAEEANKILEDIVYVPQ